MVPLTLNIISNHIDIDIRDHIIKAEKVMCFMPRIFRTFTPRIVAYNPLRHAEYDAKRPLVDTTFG